MYDDSFQDAPSHKLPKVLTPRALSFIETGIACNAITLLDLSGLAEVLIIKGCLETKDLSNFEFRQKVIIEAAIKTLCHVGILSKKDKIYLLSDLGYEICNSIPLINMLFLGYRRLFSKQYEIFKGTEYPNYSDLDCKAIAKGCSGLPISDLEIQIHNFIKEVLPQGTVCDLGCGSGNRLLSLHKSLGVRCLGIDQSAEAIAEANQSITENVLVEFIVADVLKLNRVWEDVSILMQCFMTHDISPKQNFLETMESYKIAFPNMKYFLILDVFSSDEINKEFAPGFDYIHGLQGIPTKNYNETIGLFIEADFRIKLNCRSKIFPNTCLWILEPTKKVV